MGLFDSILGGLGKVLGGAFGGDDDGSRGEDIFKWLAGLKGLQDPKFKQRPVELSPEQKEMYGRYTTSLDNPMLKGNSELASAGMRDQLQRLGGISWDAPTTSQGKTGYGGTSPVRANTDNVFRMLAEGNSPFGPQAQGAGARPPRPGGQPPTFMSPETYPSSDANDGRQTLDITPESGTGGYNPRPDDPGVPGMEGFQTDAQMGEMVTAAKEWVAAHPQVAAAGRGALEAALLGAGFPGAVIGALFGYYRGGTGGGGTGAIEGSISGGAGDWGMP